MKSKTSLSSSEKHEIDPKKLLKGLRGMKDVVRQKELAGKEKIKAQKAFSQINKALSKKLAKP